MEINILWVYKYSESCLKEKEKKKTDMELIEQNLALYLINKMYSVLIINIDFHVKSAPTCVAKFYNFLLFRGKLRKGANNAQHILPLAGNLMN